MKNIITLITLVALTLSACNKKPSVGFSASNKEPLIGEEISFSNSSSGGESYVWDFGDGESSTEQSPDHTYEKEGTYDVTLTVYSKGKKAWDKSADVIVVQHPTALFTGEIDGTETKIYSGVDGAGSDFTVDESFGTGVRNAIYEASIGNGSSGEEIGIQLGTLTVPSTYTLTQTSPFFHGIIRVMEYSYSMDLSLVPGIRIFYEAPNGTIWSTNAGSGDQTGCKLTITWTEDSSAGSTDTENFKARFNCNLYNGTGSKKVITNGTFELAFGNI